MKLEEWISISCFIAELEPEFRAFGIVAVWFEVHTVSSKLSTTPEDMFFAECIARDCYLCKVWNAASKYRSHPSFLQREKDQWTILPMIFKLPDAKVSLRNKVFGWMQQWNESWKDFSFPFRCACNAALAALAELKKRVNFRIKNRLAQISATVSVSRFCRTSGDVDDGRRR